MMIDIAVTPGGVPHFIHNDAPAPPYAAGKAEIRCASDVEWSENGERVAGLSRGWTAYPATATVALRLFMGLFQPVYTNGNDGLRGCIIGS